MRLASEGAAGITLVDVSSDGIEGTKSLVLRANPLCVARCHVANVANADALAKSFAKHKEAFGSMHLCVNNAGIGERVGDGWREVVDVNLNAVIQGTRLAVEVMTTTKSAGAVLNVASAGGVFPMPQAPVYSATKAGVILFSQSLKHLHSTKGIRVNALCPQFTDTGLVSTQFKQIGTANASSLLSQTGGALLTVEQVVDAAMELVRDDAKVPLAGQALAVMNAKAGVALVVPTPNPKFWKRVATRNGKTKETQPTKQKKPVVPPLGPIPELHRKVQVHVLTSDFAKATCLVTEKTPTPGPGEVLIQRIWTGVNASDVNFSAGRYFGSSEKAQALLPFDAGFESVGVVAALGKGVALTHPELKPGTPVATTTYGGFSEYAVAPVSLVVPVPEASPEAVALLTSGLTASIALEQLGGVFVSGDEETARGDVAETTVKPKIVLVTAAAGGTGQIAVQLAKLAGHHVIATCGGEEKALLLKSLGVDRVVNYKKENLKRVLKTEYQRGIDLVYESVGGAMFQTCVDSLAAHGTLIVIGMMSQYTTGGDDTQQSWTPSVNTGLPEKLLWKSLSVRGFFLPQHAKVRLSHAPHTAFAIAHTRPAKGLLRPEGRIPSDCYHDCLRNTNPSYTWLRD